MKQGATRGNAGVEVFTAMMVEHDAGALTIERAAATLAEQKIGGVFYQTFSAMPDYPKWRLIVWLEGDLNPGDRRAAVGKLNYLLGGALSSESFVPAQGYFFGWKADVDPVHKAVEGADFVPSRFTEILYPPMVRAETKFGRPLFPDEAEDVIKEEVRLKGGKLGTAEGRTENLKSYLIAYKRQNDVDLKQLQAESQRIVDTYFVDPHTMRADDLTSWVDRMIDFEPRSRDAAEAFNDGEGGTGLDREARQLLGIERPADLLTDQEREHFQQVIAGIPRSKNGALINKQRYVKQAIDGGRRMFLSPRFDGFKNEIIIQALDGDIRPIQDRDLTEIKLQLEGVGFPSIGTDSARELINLIAYENKFDSAKDWITGLKWDGISRVDSFLVDYASATDDPSEYTTAVSRYMFTALAGRLIDPGVKADAAPILVGAQGARKSSLVAAIAPDPEMFTEISLDVGADTPRKLNGKAVCELSELAGLGKRDLETWKSFLTQRDDRWIPKYQEHSIRRPRRCLFIGTSNREDFLRDETGHRRFLPVKVGRCYPERLAEVRDQLWAEGAALYREGGVDYTDAERLAVVQHDEYLQVPDLVELVGKILDDIVGSESWAKEPWVTTHKVIDWSEGKLGHGRGHETKVGMAFHFLKWRRQRVRLDGALVYIYHRPIKA
jgi:hypothetical protein